MLKTIFVLPDGTEVSSGVGTTNAIQSVTITECVNGAQDLTLGSVCANMVEAKIITPEGGLSIAAGDEISVYKEDFSGNRHLVGIFVMEKPTRDKANRLNVTAYDRIIHLDKDLTNWLKDMGQEVSLLDFAKQVCAQCGLQLANAELPNGGYIVPSFTKAGVTGRQLMRWIGEVCGRFCRANADGKIEFAWYTPVNASIGPREIATANLTVDSDGEVIIDSKSVNVIDDGEGSVTMNSEALSISDDGQGNAELTALSSANQLPYFQGSLSFGDYEVAKVDAVQLSMADGQDGYLWPEAAAGANSYIISGNPLLNRAADDMRPVVQTILDQIKGMTYTPCKISLLSTSDIHAGSIVQITDSNGKTLTAYVMTKTQTGQKDTLECTGNHRRDSTTAQNNKTVDQIAQEKVDAQTQGDVFSKLTNGGKTKGIYMEDGELYINASYIKSGELLADLIKAGVLSSSDDKIRIDLSGGEKPIFNSGISTNGIVVRGDVADVAEVFSAEAKMGPQLPYFDMRAKSASDGKTIARLSESFKNGAVRDGAQFLLQTADGHHQVNLAVSDEIAGIVVFCDGTQVGYLSILHDSAGNPALSLWSDKLYIKNKKVGWSDNGDGTYTLIGT